MWLRAFTGATFYLLCCLTERIDPALCRVFSFQGADLSYLSRLSALRFRHW